MNPQDITIMREPISQTPTTVAPSAIPPLSSESLEAPVALPVEALPASPTPVAPTPAAYTPTPTRKKAKLPGKAAIITGFALFMFMVVGAAALFNLGQQPVPWGGGRY